MMINMEPLGPGEVEEKVSIFVEIESVGDDIAHPDGFQVDFYGISPATGAYVNCVNMFRPDEKDLADELISTILPGTCWYVTGNPLIMHHRGITAIHDCSFQAFDPWSIDRPTNESGVNKISNRPENRSNPENFPGYKYEFQSTAKGIACENENNSKAEMLNLIENIKEDVQEHIWKIFAYHSDRPQCMNGWLMIANRLSETLHRCNKLNDGKVHYNKEQLEEVLTNALFGDMAIIENLMDFWARSEYAIVYVSKESHRKLKKLSNKFTDSILEGIFCKTFTVSETELL